MSDGGKRQTVKQRVQKTEPMAGVLSQQRGDPIELRRDEAAAAHEGTTPKPVWSEVYTTTYPVSGSALKETSGTLRPANFAGRTKSTLGGVVLSSTSACPGWLVCTPGVPS